MTELSNFLNKNLVKICRKNYQVTIICIIFFSILSLKSIYNITMLETNELLRKLTSFMEFDPLWPNFSFLQPLKTSENLWFPNLSIDSKWEFFECWFMLYFQVFPNSQRDFGFFECCHIWDSHFPQFMKNMKIGCFEYKFRFRLQRFPNLLKCWEIVIFEVPFISYFVRLWG